MSTMSTIDAITEYRITINGAQATHKSYPKNWEYIAKRAAELGYVAALARRTIFPGNTPWQTIAKIG